MDITTTLDGYAETMILRDGDGLLYQILAVDPSADTITITDYPVVHGAPRWIYSPEQISDGFVVVA